MDIIYSLSGKVTGLPTHILADVEKVRDNIMILHKGKVVMETSITDLKFMNPVQLCCSGREGLQI